jgi:hypothetical protein
MSQNNLMGSSPCPDILEFERFRCGALPANEMDRLTRHLDTCPRCAEEVKRLFAGDSSVGGSASVSSVDTMRSDQAISTPPEEARGVADWPSLASREGITKDLINEASRGLIGAEELYDFLLPVVESGAAVSLGPYRVVGVLGIGGMGIVLKAEDPKLGRSVAIKMLKPAFTASGAARQRFLREAQAAAGMTNEHVVPIYHVGEDRGVPYLVMPFLAGETLEHRRHREERLPLAEVLRIGREVAVGLAAAHERGLIHRDIKPANLWLDADRGKIRILDFGLARIEEESSELSQLGHALGTPAYMAPEQSRGEKVGPRADLFSLGCVLYRLSTGVGPFDGPTPRAVCHALEHEEPRRPEQLRSELPKAFSELVLRLLAKNPADRPASARDVVREIESIEDKQEPGSPRAKRPRRPWVMWIATAVGLFLLAIAYATGPTIYRLVTDQGDLVIETNDPGVEVVIKDRTGKVIDRTAKREILLKAGEYEIECVISDPLGEQKFLTRRLNIRRGDRLVVDAHIESVKKANEAASKVLQAQEIRAAHWALSRGATGKILVRGNREDLALARDERTGTFQIVNLVFGPDSKLTDAELDRLGEIPNLASLKLQGPWASDASLARIRGLSNLRRLDLVSVRMSDAGLAYVGELTNLEHLILINVPVTDAGLGHLRALRNLRHLALGYTRVTEAGMEHLASLPNLTGWLTLDNSKVTDAWFPRLAKLSKLAGLSVAHNPVGDAALASIGAFQNLQELNLSYTKVGDAGLAHLKSLGKLNTLRLAGVGVGDAGLLHLRGLAPLRELDLTKTKVTANGVADLQKALPRCRILFEPEGKAGK